MDFTKFILGKDGFIQNMIAMAYTLFFPVWVFLRTLI